MADAIVRAYDPDDASVTYRQQSKTATWTVKAGLAQMLKGAARVVPDTGGWRRRSDVELLVRLDDGTTFVLR